MNAAPAVRRPERDEETTAVLDEFMDVYRRGQITGAKKTTDDFPDRQLWTVTMWVRK